MKQHDAALICRTDLRVRFSEVDSMQVVWHGEYVRYMEDGREAFGRQYGIGYADILNAGFFVPIVELDIRYRHSLRYGESAVVETRYIRTDAAKIQFEYIIYGKETGNIAATGATTQVFIDRKTSRLELNSPDFYNAWKARWNL